MAQSQENNIGYDINEIYHCHKLTIYKICFMYMKSKQDAEDILQETFTKFIKQDKTFESDEHIKAWLIRTSSNLCKNQLKHWWRKRADIDDYKYLEDTNTKSNDILKEVLNLPTKYKNVIYLYYYEGYNSMEIAKILNIPNSTIRNHLSEARKILKIKLGDDFDEK